MLEGVLVEVDTFSEPQLAAKQFCLELRDLRTKITVLFLPLVFTSTTHPTLYLVACGQGVVCDLLLRRNGGIIVEILLLNPPFFSGKLRFSFVPWWPCMSAGGGFCESRFSGGHVGRCGLPRVTHFVFLVVQSQFHGPNSRRCVLGQSVTCSCA